MGEDGRVLIWIVAFIAAAGLGFAGLVGIGCAIGANQCPFSKKNAAASTTDGKALFAVNCAACHGATGTGGRGPSLTAGPQASLTEAQLRAKIARGRPFFGMPRFKGTLTEEQIAAIARTVIDLREAS